MMKTEYPFNLYTDIFGVIDFELPEDAVSTVAYLLTSNFNDEKINIIILRYKCCRSLKDISLETGHSYDYIRQAIYKIIRKLRHPESTFLLKNGVNKVIHLSNDEEISEEEYEKTLNDLDLTTRTFNAIYRMMARECLTKLAEIPVFYPTKSSLLKIKNMGVKSVNEFIQKMSSIGIEFIDE